MIKTIKLHQNSDDVFYFQLNEYIEINKNDGANKSIKIIGKSFVSYRLWGQELQQSNGCDIIQRQRNKIKKKLRRIKNKYKIN